MRIITPGNLEKLDPRVTLQCKKCDCVFEVKTSEMSTYHPDQRDMYDPREQSYKYFSCPTCKSRVTESDRQKPFGSYQDR